MHDDLTGWQHGHSFGQEVRRPGEGRTLLVIAITATMMVVEIVGPGVYAAEVSVVAHAPVAADAYKDRLPR
ncbi:MAG: hypothetical protein ACM3MJ_07770, partial [Deltaproteobacteria bacterium]